MITFFSTVQGKVIYAVQSHVPLTTREKEALGWLFGEALASEEECLFGLFRGPRREMITPWSTNAVEITQIMGIEGILRIEEFVNVEDTSVGFDPMLEAVYQNLDQQMFEVSRQPEPIQAVHDIAAYNNTWGLALNAEEVAYLENVSKQIGRPLTDSEVFGFSQVNSEHCRHKIFNGLFVVNGKTLPDSLFDMIRRTTRIHPGRVVSAYRDNVAFIEGPGIRQFAPEIHDIPDEFRNKEIHSVISLKAETHNFPTTVEPFNGAATGSGGEIRDRMAGGQGSLPLAGTAVYMTSYPRTGDGRDWEKGISPRPWLYQTPEDILIKASNGASDFGNKFGQPLICGSLLTFEFTGSETFLGFDKVIMLAGGIGYARSEHAQKKNPNPGERIVVMGGDNYRIGMGGGAVSSVATGQYANAIELNAVQRSNPEMQKRVANAIRAMCESEENPLVSIHDHGAGGHLNSLSELVEARGGKIWLDRLPVGDPTLSDKEIIGNESQERMGLVIASDRLEYLKAVARRERAPLYDVGEITGDGRFIFEDNLSGRRPMDLPLEFLFGKPPRTVLEDTETRIEYSPLRYDPAHLNTYLEQVLQCEAVACKDWLTNKADRSVSGRIAHQQTTGPLQLPLNNLGVVALDYEGKSGIATSIGHAPVAALIDASAGSRLAVAEALTNLVWAPLAHGIHGVSLSANWMWPCHNPGENARLYQAVQAISDFSVQLGINIPTGKDSLSMTQKYPDGTRVLSPGTVIVSAVSEVSDVRRVISPVIKYQQSSTLYYVDFSGCGFALGGSSLAQVLKSIGNDAPDADPAILGQAFVFIQNAIQKDLVLAGHDVSAGGLLTCLLEMLFSHPQTGARICTDIWEETDPIRLFFSEKPAVVVQVSHPEVFDELARQFGVAAMRLGEVLEDRRLEIQGNIGAWSFDVDALRELWFRTSYLLDRRQSGEKKALERFLNYAKAERRFRFPSGFDGTLLQNGLSHRRETKSKVKAAIIREKGSNGDREMAYALWLAGFDVKDVHMTDLVTGRETLEDVKMIAFVGGFSNSDVLGSAKGWAGAFLYNEKAKVALDRFYARPDTLSLGVCNGCQLMVELGLIQSSADQKVKMLHNETGKYESSFLTVRIEENHSVMLSSLAGCELGIWVAHGEGRFSFSHGKDCYHIPAVYSYDFFPGNPNGSMYNAACIASDDGRHLAIMPHLERSVFPWQWAWYPEDRNREELSPWILAFVNARHWLENH